jgi:hypothetical protein
MDIRTPRFHQLRLLDVQRNANPAANPAATGSESSRVSGSIREYASAPTSCNTQASDDISHALPLDGKLSSMRRSDAPREVSALTTHSRES